MNRKCYKMKCSRDVTFSCNCLIPNIISCSKHISKHLQIEVKHETSSLQIKLSSSKYQELIARTKKVLEYLNTKRNNLVIIANEAIDSINRKLSIALKNISEYKTILIKSLYKHALRRKSINKQLHEFFSNVTTEENNIDSLQINQLREKISSIFNFTLNES